MSSHRARSLQIAGFCRPSALRRSIAVVLVGSLVLGSCGKVGGGGAPSAKERADAVVAELEEIPNPQVRAAASVLVLNSLCSISRLANGQSDGRVEQALVPYFSGLKPETKTRIRRVGETLRAIPAAERTALLGKLSVLDPGACIAAPKWDDIRSSVVFALQQPPRMRTNFCSDNFDYADGSSGARAITSASVTLQKLGGELGPDIVAPAASPVILGVEGAHVSARHPALAATATTPIGDGMTPFGVVTNISCTSASGCDPALGMFCSTRLGGENQGHCIAYPVVQKDQELILRGYNFWDVEAARLVFTPLFPGEGSESTSVVEAVDPNEPTDGTAACPPASASNPTHNRAHFRVAANEGAFYKLRLFNHNGAFRTQQDGIDLAPPRVVHVCYPQSSDQINVPPDTVRGCTAPIETCPQDGVQCAATWTTKPRKIEDCRHLPGQPAPCFETPEWFANQPLTRRADPFPGTPDDPVVFVLNDEPTYEFRTTLEDVVCNDETGRFDFTGSDEPMLGVFGFPMPPPPGAAEDLAKTLDDNSQAWHGEDFDSGERKKVAQLLSTVGDLKFDSQVFYIIMLLEDDSELEQFLAGAAVIVAAAAIIYFTGGTGFWTTVGGGAAALAIWAAITGDTGEDDLLGKATALATPLAMEERIAASHAPDFLTVNPPATPVLPTMPGIANEGERSGPRLIHPFVELPVKRLPVLECNPGNCPSGKVCLVNLCVDPGFVDPTTGRGFRERREYVLDRSHYTIDLLWERFKTP